MRDRVIEIRRVRASELKANPLNWGNHDDDQRRSIRAVLDSIGFVSGVIGVVRPEGIRLIDGHMRAETADDEVIPVQITDLTEDEERMILALFDPIGLKRKTDGDALTRLLADLRTDNEAIEDVLEDLAKTAKDVESGGADSVSDSVVMDQAVQLRPEREYIVILCDDDGGAQWEALRAALGLKLVRRGGYKIGSAFDDSGIERVIPAGRLLGILGGNGDA